MSRLKRSKQKLEFLIAPRKVAGSVKLPAVHRPGIWGVRARHLVASLSQGRVLALDVLEGVDDEGMSISILSDDDAESCDELLVSV